MLPVSDHNPRSGPAVITIGLVVACVGIFIYQMQLGPLDGPAVFSFVYEYGFVPAEFFGDPLAGTVPEVATIFTSMFLHGDILHLAGNMLYLWIFGDNIEDVMGGIKFLVFYILCGIVAALTQGYVSPDSTIPMIGASGAISGVLGAYIFLFPLHRVYVWVGFGVIPVPAFFVLGLYMAAQIWYAVQMPADQPGVAFWAHIGGFVAGAVLHRFFMLGRRF